MRNWRTIGLDIIYIVSVYELTKEYIQPFLEGQNQVMMIKSAMLCGHCLRFRKIHFYGLYFQRVEYWASKVLRRAESLLR